MKSQFVTEVNGNIFKDLKIVFEACVIESSAVMDSIVDEFNCIIFNGLIDEVGGHTFMI